jgi:hypothetical protein
VPVHLAENILNIAHETNEVAEDDEIVFAFKVKIIGIHHQEFNVLVAMLFFGPADVFLTEVDAGFYRTLYARKEIAAATAYFEDTAVFMRKILNVMDDLIPVIGAEFAFPPFPGQVVKILRGRRQFIHWTNEALNLGKKPVTALEEAEWIGLSNAGKQIIKLYL